MKKSIIISAIIFGGITSCNSSSTDDRQNETPKALTDKGSSFEFVSKRGPDELVESLYRELAAKTPELKEFESKLDKLNESWGDSIELFDKYNGKNDSYYQAANNQVEKITDSVIRDKMKTLIANSLDGYNKNISPHQDILNYIEKKRVTLRDLYAMLKITRTLPLIHTYQKDNLPSLKSLEGYSKEQDKIIQIADTLVKK